MQHSNAKSDRAGEAPIVVSDPRHLRASRAAARPDELVQKADVHRRFRLYTPVTRGGTLMYVHAKILIMDDRLMRVGSSNLNNRSLSYDTECDLAVEAYPGTPGEPDLRKRIVDLRTTLLAEHLDVEPAALTLSLEQAGGSLTSAIEALRGDGRSAGPPANDLGLGKSKNGAWPGEPPSAQSEESKNNQDDHDEANDVDDLVHEFLRVWGPRIDHLQFGVQSRPRANKVNDAPCNLFRQKMKWTQRLL